MLVTCIHCAHVWEDAAPVGKQTCPMCRQEFPYEPEYVQLLRLFVQRSDGELEGPVDADTIRERCYLGVYNGREHVRIRDGMWVPITGWPLFEEVLRMVGVDVDSIVHGVSGERGWQKKAVLVPGTSETAKARQLVVERTAERREKHARVVERIQEEEQDSGRRVFAFVVGGALVLAAGGLIAMVLTL